MVSWNKKNLKKKNHKTTLRLEDELVGWLKHLKVDQLSDGQHVLPASNDHRDPHNSVARAVSNKEKRP